MPTAKNGFWILNLHPKKHRKQKNTFFGNYPEKCPVQYESGKEIAIPLLIDF